MHSVTLANQQLTTSMSSNPYSDVLTMYLDAPVGEGNIFEIEALGLERLELFRIFIKSQVNGHTFLSDSWKSDVHMQLKNARSQTYLQLLGFEGVSDEETRRKDYIAMFISTVVFSELTERYQWFIARELELFKFRFLMLNQQDAMKFLEKYDLLQQFTKLSCQQKQSMKSELEESTEGLTSFDETDFYAVPFTRVPSLIKERAVYVQKGFAYIPDYALWAIACDAYAKHVPIRLRMLRRMVGADSRIDVITKQIQNEIKNPHGDAAAAATMNLENLDLCCNLHYPLCMRSLHKKLRQEHHLKHGSRVQYGVFLKELGVSVEDAITFWREEFTKNMPEEQFIKKYVYYIKYIYGLTGRKQPVAAYTCEKILKASPTCSDCYGCPFKHSTTEELIQKLKKCGLENVDGILALVSKKLYQEACTEYFNATHTKPNEGIVQSPNEYVNSSRRQPEACILDIEDIVNGEETDTE